MKLIKRLLFLLPLLFINLLHADTITSGVGLLKPTTGVIDTTRSWADKYNKNFDIIASTLGQLSTATGTIGVRLNNLDTSTNAITTRVNNLDNSTSAITIRLNNLDSSTSAITTKIGNLNSSTATLTIRLNNLDSSTGSLRTDFNTSTSALTTRLNNLDTSTSNITNRADVVAIATASLWSNLYQIVSTNVVGGISGGSGFNSQTIVVGTDTTGLNVGVNIASNTTYGWAVAISSIGKGGGRVVVMPGLYTHINTGARIEIPKNVEFYFVSGATLTNDTVSVNVISCSGTISGRLSVLPANSWTNIHYIGIFGGARVSGIDFPPGMSVGDLVEGLADSTVHKRALIKVSGLNPIVRDITYRNANMGGAGQANGRCFFGIQNSSNYVVENITYLDPISLKSTFCVGNSTMGIIRNILWDSKVQEGPGFGNCGSIQMPNSLLTVDNVVIKMANGHDNTVSITQVFKCDDCSFNNMRAYNSGTTGIGWEIVNSSNTSFTNSVSSGGFIGFQTRNTTNNAYFGNIRAYNVPTGITDSGSNTFLGTRMFNGVKSSD